MEQYNTRMLNRILWPIMDALLLPGCLIMLAAILSPIIYIVGLREHEEWLANAGYFAFEVFIAWGACVILTFIQMTLCGYNEARRF